MPPATCLVATAVFVHGMGSDRVSLAWQVQLRPEQDVDIHGHAQGRFLVIFSLIVGFIPIDSGWLTAIAKSEKLLEFRFFDC